MRAIDTKVLVRLVVRDDPTQTAAAERFIEGGAWVPLVALAEMGWVLTSIYHLTAAQLADAIEMLLDQSNVVLQDFEAVQAALALFRDRPFLGFSDCLVLETAREAGHVPLGTFDRKLASVDGAQRL